ncbi:c-type cytochrome [Gloeomargaritales cyanobacterium VI4D9]|nr:c-type cytochrome [Gloeomargaritales cyanobacterium VI4D9]
MRVVLTVLFAVGMMLGSWVMPAQAADIAHGGKVFGANCAACHAGGRNVVVASKSLKKEDLAKYGMDLEAIVYQVTNGKNAMPAFKGRLSATDIEDVANYVVAQAEKGW